MVCTGLVSASGEIHNQFLLQNVLLSLGIGLSLCLFVTHTPLSLQGRDRGRQQGSGGEPALPLVSMRQLGAQADPEILINDCRLLLH